MIVAEPGLAVVRAVPAIHPEHVAALGVGAGVDAGVALVAEPGLAVVRAVAAVHAVGVPALGVGTGVLALVGVVAPLAVVALAAGEAVHVSALTSQTRLGDAIRVAALHVEAVRVVVDGQLATLVVANHADLHLVPAAHAGRADADQVVGLSDLLDVFGDLGEGLLQLVVVFGPLEAVLAQVDQLLLVHVAAQPDGEDVGLGAFDRGLGLRLGAGHRLVGSVGEEHQRVGVQHVGIGGRLEILEGLDQRAVEVGGAHPVAGRQLIERLVEQVVVGGEVLDRAEVARAGELVDRHAVAIGQQASHQLAGRTDHRTEVLILHDRVGHVEQHQGEQLELDLLGQDRGGRSLGLKLLAVEQEADVVVGQIRDRIAVAGGGLEDGAHAGRSDLVGLQLDQLDAVVELFRPAGGEQGDRDDHQWSMAAARFRGWVIHDDLLEQSSDQSNLVRYCSSSASTSSSSGSPPSAVEAVCT